jgi:uncharacterized protein YdbL (DUF1318 family)
MTPKEKAKELIEKYLKLDIEIGGQYDGYLTMKMHDAKQCALIAVEEINKAIDFDWMEVQNLESEHRYWDKVEQEIKNL